jgi:hypothetical protein
MNREEEGRTTMGYAFVHAMTKRLSPIALGLAFVACRGSTPQSDPPPRTAPVAVAPTDPAQPTDPTKTPTQPSQPDPGPPEPKDPPPPPPPVIDGHDFKAEMMAMWKVGACGNAEGVALPDTVPAELVQKHCDETKKFKDEFKTKWVDVAKPFFDERRPTDLPKRVVYPFAGGDLASALAVYTDADEITTLSLEPAGDPRTLESLKGKSLSAALELVRDELRWLYRVNFSNTMNLIDAMRGGQLPTQLIFSLSALDVFGFEPVGLWFYKIEKDGTLNYLDDADLAKAPAAGKGQVASRNRVFGNMELHFRKPGESRIRIYRHIQQNLDDDHLPKNPGVMAHLEAKGDVAGMTKAASYLLSFESFGMMREYLLTKVVWMVSDATGVPERYGKKKGMVYETWGSYVGAHMTAGKRIGKEWAVMWKAQPARELKFRFGYHDSKVKNHLVIMKRAAGG